MNLREIQEKREQDQLSPFAAHSGESLGRMTDEEECPCRTAFQRDTDRVIHSKAFRRLMHKTQVFISPSKDHYRTRLTHTLEVSGIARSIVRGLFLNENLVEAMALGHDLGHTPFGHTGEDALNEVCEDGFAHNEQSLRVVDILEREGGLNLTFEVRDGILNHTGNNLAATLEGRVLKFADRIAYINHDIDDALRAGVFETKDLPCEYLDILGNTHKERINNMIMNVIDASLGKNEITMTEPFYKAMMGLRSFMFERVYLSKAVKKEEEKSKGLVMSLYDYFLKHPHKLPEEYREKLNATKVSRVVCDYIAGMTDRYAIRMFSDLFVPKSY